ncbi:MAG TPA: chorismate mutase [Saprospiraceae bacterium]|nr:chorismate mutase [Saprospiraceae bacterium]HMQ81661.1 chorismate mutase [Saprospiraceae bacterium]
MKDSTLDNYRAQLDELDNEIVALILKRLKVCEAIGHYKKAHDIPMMQPHRVQLVKEKAARLAEAAQLNPQFMEAIYTLIIQEACELQNKIIDP